MIIYYMNIVTFLFTIYIAFRIGKELRKKTGFEKTDIKELMNFEKELIKKSLKAGAHPLSTDHKKNLYNILEEIDKNYSKLIRFTIAISIVPLTVIFILHLALQDMVLLTIGGFDLKWQHTLLILVPIMLLKLGLRIKKRQSTTNTQ